MKIIEKSAKTEEEAINKVLEELGMDNRGLIQNVEVLSSSRGLLGIGAKKVKVRVTVYEQPEREAEKLVSDFIQLMGIKVHKIKVSENGDSKILIEIETDKDSLLIGKRGKTLESIQYLVNIMMNKRRAEKIKVLLDIQHYRDKRVQSLQKLAKNLALKVKQTRREKILEPMNPFERKIIHTALQDHPEIKTESLGNGIFKKIRIGLKK